MCVTVEPRPCFLSVLLLGAVKMRRALSVSDSWRKSNEKEKAKRSGAPVSSVVDGLLAGMQVQYRQAGSHRRATPPS